jgi:hypothetical protein
VVLLIVCSEEGSHSVFGKPLNESLKYASVQISTAKPNGELYVWGFIPVVVAKWCVHIPGRCPVKSYRLLQWTISEGEWYDISFLYQYLFPSLESLQQPRSRVRFVSMDQTSGCETCKQCLKRHHECVYSQYLLSPPSSSRSNHSTANRWIGNRKLILRTMSPVSSVDI